MSANQMGVVDRFCTSLLMNDHLDIDIGFDGVHALCAALKHVPDLTSLNLRSMISRAH